MSSLYISFPDEAARLDFTDGNRGFEYVPGAHLLDAIYGDDLVDAQDDRGLYSDLPVLPRRGVGGDDDRSVELIPAGMPMPWPTVVGHDGMSAHWAGVAMKPAHGQWVPVAWFDPPLSAFDQAKANERAAARYLDRCAEHAVLGGVGASKLAGSRP